MFRVVALAAPAAGDVSQRQEVIMLSYRNAFSFLAALAAMSVLALPAIAAGPAKAVPAVTRADLFADWCAQDMPSSGQACFENKVGCDVEMQMVGLVIQELGDGGRRLFSARLAELSDANVPGTDSRWRALYVDACQARRTKRLAPLLSKYPRIVYTKHYDLGGSHYAYTEGQSDAQNERTFKPGSALCLLRADGGLGETRVLAQDAGGVIRDPDVSYDGKRILFAWKKSDRQDDYHLYEMEAATGRVRQLTAGLGFADYEGAYLPDGNIIFNSTRCVQTVDCWWTEVSNLYICDKNGRYMRRVGFDQVHTNYPTVTDDGRVLYTRWEYNDRGQIFPQPLFQMNPDGTGQTEAYGNNSWFPTTIMHARGIPGTQKILAVLSGHHNLQRGKLAVLDPSVGTQEATGAVLVAPIRETKAVRVDAYGQDGEQFQYPYPVTETQFLVTYRPQGVRNRQNGRWFGIYFIDMDGRRELLATDARISCQQPVPLARRPVSPLRPSTVDYRKTTGVYYVRDVYAGGGLKGVARGTVKRLRVVTMEFRAAGIGENYSNGPAGGALASTPVAIDNAAWDVKVVLGSVPVHQDGSAMFVVPARTPVYFQLLDANDSVVQSMRSWSTLQPGETFSCVGCHEAKNDASPAEGYVSQAVRQGAVALKPFYGPARGFSFPKEIQPILDKHCIRCHNDRSARIKATADGREKSQTIALTNPKVLLPIGSMWRHTTDKPSSGWTAEKFDDSKWKTGQAGFGTPGTPGGKVATAWQTSDIWMRTTFTLPASWDMSRKLGVIRWCHDEDVDVYINGHPAGKDQGFITNYSDVPMDMRLLRPGVNVVAMHCRQTSGGQFVDLALLEGGDSKSQPQVAAKPAEKPLPPGEKKAFSLLGEPNLDKRAKRYWSDSYLALTQSGRPNGIVQWLNVQSIPPMLPPYFAGSARSGLISMLAAGHNGVKLSREGMDKLRCWIDLLVPYCGDYTEANAWNDHEKRMYARYLAKRQQMEAWERTNIKAMLAGKPSPPPAAAVTGSP